MFTHISFGFSALSFNHFWTDGSTGSGAPLPCVPDFTFIKLMLDKISPSDVSWSNFSLLPVVESGQTPALERTGQCLSAESRFAQTERNKSMRKPSLQWSVSGVSMPCSKARLFRWKMVLRLVSPARACGRPACRTAWFMRVVISAVATWINHVARIKLLLNDAQHFLQVPQPPSRNHSH